MERLEQDGVDSGENDGAEDMEIDTLLDLEQEKLLQQTSMFHYTLRAREQTSVLHFENNAVHSLYNLLLNYVRGMRGNKF